MASPARVCDETAAETAAEASAEATSISSDPVAVVLVAPIAGAPKRPAAPAANGG